MLDMGWDPCSAGGYTICCRGVRNNHLKFIQLITNWQAEGRLAWRLFRPLATRSRDLCGLHSERQSGVISNFSNNLILFKYSNTYLHFQSPRRSSALVKLHCEHLVDFFPRHYEGEVKAEKFQIYIKFGFNSRCLPWRQ